jgi:ankyrin repeat protein
VVAKVIYAPLWLLITISMVPMSMPRQRQGKQYCKRSPRREMEELIRYGADANAKTEAGETVLYWVVNYGDAWVVELLLKHNANVLRAGKVSERKRFGAP